MKFEKKFMSVSELVALGFPRAYIYRLAHRKNQDYMFRINNGRKSKMMFDTEALQKAISSEVFK